MVKLLLASAVPTAIAPETPLMVNTASAINVELDE
jgi:hypothetical protein